MPNIEIDISDRAARHLGAIRLMSYMLFPDDAKLRLADEITLRTITVNWCSSRFAKEDSLPRGREDFHPRSLGSLVAGAVPRRHCAYHLVHAAAGTHPALV